MSPLLFIPHSGALAQNPVGADDGADVGADVVGATLTLGADVGARLGKSLGIEDESSRLPASEGGSHTLSLSPRPPRMSGTTFPEANRDVKNNKEMRADFILLLCYGMQATFGVAVVSLFKIERRQVE